MIFIASETINAKEGVDNIEIIEMFDDVEVIEVSHEEMNQINFEFFGIKALLRDQYDFPPKTTVSFGSFNMRPLQQLQVLSLVY